MEESVISKEFGTVCLLDNQSSGDQCEYKDNKIILFLQVAGFGDSDIVYQFTPKDNIIRIEGNSKNNGLTHKMVKIYQLGSTINKVKANKIIDGILKLEFEINNDVQFEHQGEIG